MIDLKVIIDKYPGSITNSRLMKSLLTDYYPGSEYKSRINILAAMINCGIIDNILKTTSVNSFDVAKYSTRMETEMGYSKEISGECVEIWATALGKFNSSEDDNFIQEKDKSEEVCSKSSIHEDTKINTYICQSQTIGEDKENFSNNNHNELVSISGHKSVSVSQNRSTQVVPKDQLLMGKGKDYYEKGDLLNSIREYYKLHSEASRQSLRICMATFSTLCAEYYSAQYDAKIYKKGYIRIAAIIEGGKVKVIESFADKKIKQYTINWNGVIAISLTSRSSTYNTNSEGIYGLKLDGTLIYQNLGENRRKNLTKERIRI